MTSQALQPRNSSRSLHSDGTSLVLQDEDTRQLPLPPPFTVSLPTVEPVILFTIGHGNLPADGLVALLHVHAVDVVIDVRSSPYSRYVPHCNREALAALMTVHGLAYEWAGDTLGGRPDDASCYFGGEVKIGDVDYAQVAERSWFQAGLQALVAISARQRAALLCSEEDPRRCHRHKLIAQALHDLGVRVLHIRRSGELEEADALEIRGAEPGTLQLPMCSFATRTSTPPA